MATQTVCPYYARNEESCDVGCGYISSHDASMISRYCSTDFNSCIKYRELQHSPDNRDGSPTDLPMAAAPGRENRNIALGLSGGGIAILLYIFCKIGLFSTDIRIPALALIGAAIMQMLAGTAALREKSIRALMFIGGGLFWTSMLALEILPAAGFGTATAAIPMSGYLVLWGFFGLIPAQAGTQISRICRHFYTLGAVFLFMLAALPLFPKVLHLMVYGTGIMTGICGVWAGGQYLLKAASTVSALDRKQAKT
ncbi:MAG: hypothetical protein C0623_10350 [Desulfuromonas sp.]|nr:MAG: hypothetical protein C0623_10350 [Desulfuromonas sp.]